MELQALYLNLYSFSHTFTILEDSITSFRAQSFISASAGASRSEIPTC